MSKLKLVELTPVDGEGKLAEPKPKMVLNLDHVDTYSILDVGAYRQIVTNIGTFNIQESLRVTKSRLFDDGDSPAEQAEA